MAHCYLEAGLRKKDTEIIIHALTKFIEIGHEPDHRALKLLGNLKHIPDELFFLLRKNFTNYGSLLQRVRQFEKPTFNTQPARDRGLMLRNLTGKRYNPKKSHKKELPYTYRKTGLGGVR